LKRGKEEGIKKTEEEGNETEVVDKENKETEKEEDGRSG
jgi:hypothetical protein